MEECRNLVKQALSEIFEPGSVTYEEFNLMPGGIRVRDKGGEELLFYWDILYNKLAWVEGKKKGSNRG